MKLQECRSKTLHSCNSWFDRVLGCCEICILGDGSCEKCENELKSIDSQLRLIKNKFNLLAIMPDYDKTSDLFRDITIIDYSGVYFKAIQITKYPSFVIANKNNGIESRFDTVEGLLRDLDKL